MPSINIGEKEFEVLAQAANDAKDRGDMEQALALDKLARKVNAALSSRHPLRIPGSPNQGRGIPWEEVPSTLRG